MKYYVAADGGGTKVLSVLYDEDFNIIRTANTFGVNSNFKPREQVEWEIQQLMERLIPEDVLQIERVDVSFVDDEDVFLDALSRKCEMKDWAVHGEGQVALACAGYTYGIVAQAGTGSDAFLVQPDFEDMVGGWGAFLGDEGSGYDVGHNTLKAAIYAHDGRGPKTAILDILMEDWNLKELWDIVNIGFSVSDHRPLVASAARIAAKAAKLNDPVAIKIYEDAAREMVLQVNTLIARHENNWHGPIVVSGGTWKGCERMYEVFCEEVKKVYPDVTICKPMFEPIIGCIAIQPLLDGMSFEEFKDTYQEKFKEYLL